MSGSDIIADPTQHPAMRRFAAAVRALYGDRVERIVLYGSRARGDAREDSDWDVALFIRDLRDWWTEAEPLGAIEVAIMDDTGAVINALPFGAGAYLERTPLMRELRREGRDL
jgi:predicted nucleotidyltransferase